MTTSIDRYIKRIDQKIALKKGSGGSANLFMFYLKNESDDYLKLVPTDNIRLGNIMSSTNQMIVSENLFNNFIELNQILRMDIIQVFFPNLYILVFDD